MKRLLLPLSLLLVGLALAALLGCEAASVDSMSAGDADSDGDSDGDSDSDSDVDIEYPEFISPYLDLTGAMTGPISPPPEDFGAEQDDWDAGVLEEGYDEDVDEPFDGAQGEGEE